MDEGARRAEAPSTALTLNLLAQVAYGLLVMTVCLPSMPVWGELFGRPQDEVQLTFSGFVLTFGLLQLVYGPLSDRYGRRAMILTGLVVGVAGSVLAALAQSLPRARLALIPNAGHMVALEAPEAVAEAMAEFLATLGPSS